MKFCQISCFLVLALIYEASGVCFEEYMTKLSRYAHHGTPAEVDWALARLSELGITRVDFNVWADGSIYFNSTTAINQGAVYRSDNLQWAVEAGNKYGIDIFAWFEYGSMAGYGSNLNPFAQHADDNDWLLYNVRDGEKVYLSEGQGAGNYVYLNPQLVEVQLFLADVMADAVRDYDIAGIQFGDHLRWPNGFDILDNYTKSERFAYMEEFVQRIRDAVKSAKPEAVIAFSPSPLLFAQDNHNVNWTDWLQKKLVDNLLPQYYRTNAASFELTLNQDLSLISGPLTHFYTCVRLSGAQEPQLTPPEEVDRMLEITSSRNLTGISFWFADNLIDGDYDAPINCST